MFKIKKLFYVLLFSLVFLGYFSCKAKEKEDEPIKKPVKQESPFKKGDILPFIYLTHFDLFKTSHDFESIRSVNDGEFINCKEKKFEDFICIKLEDFMRVVDILKERNILWDNFYNNQDYFLNLSMKD